MSYFLFFSFLGLFLIYLEFFLPSALFVLLGSISTLYATYRLFLSNEHLYLNLGLVALQILGIYITCRLALKHIYMSKKKNSFFLSTTQEGFKAADHPDKKIDTEGKTCSDLHPFGYVEIEGQILEAMALNSYISKGVSVKVIGQRNGYLIVKQFKE